MIDKEEDEGKHITEKDVVNAARDADTIDALKQLLEDAPEEMNLAAACDEETGVTALMSAAAMGNSDAVELLLEKGGVWNAQDRRGRTAGEHAIDADQYAVAERILDHAVRCELILGAAARRTREAERNEESVREREEAYLRGSVKYVDDDADGGDVRLVDENNDGVMMAWEAPIMEAHAEAMMANAATGGDDNGDDKKDELAVLNVGYGLGLIDQAIRRRKPRVHAIIEAHPEVLKRMHKDGFVDGERGVRIGSGKWQDVLSTGTGGLLLNDDDKFDCIFFDTYGEYYHDMAEFHALLPSLLKTGGIYSFFNGLAPDNIFFQAVYARIIELELKRLGIKAEFVRLEIQRPEGDTWLGVRQRYYYNDYYYMPLCRRLDVQEVEEA